MNEYGKRRADLKEACISFLVEFVNFHLKKKIHLSSSGDAHFPHFKLFVCF